MKPYLLTSHQIQQMPSKAKIHFLNPNAVRANKSLGDATGLTGLGIHLIEVEPGRETTEFHAHIFEDEAVYVLLGKAEARLGDEVFVIGPGDFLGYRKNGLAHTIKNTGKELLRCLVIGERLAHDVCDYPDKAKRLYRSQGQPWELVDHKHIQTPPAGAGRK